MFGDLTFEELTLLEDMIFSASEKTFDVYGEESPIFTDVAAVWWSVLFEVQERGRAA